VSGNSLARVPPSPHVRRVLRRIVQSSAPARTETIEPAETGQRSVKTMKNTSTAAGPLRSRLCVVLVATRNPLNIGSVARAMSNFGFTHLRVVNPYDPAFREAKSAVGASTLLKKAQEYKSVAEAVADCALVVGTTSGHKRELEHELRPLQEGGVFVRQSLRGGRVALLFGSEKRGLSNQDLSFCHWLIRIPTTSKQPSMNLAQAVALCLYELARESARPARKATRSAAPAADIDRFTELLLDAVRTSGYLKQSAGADEKIRRLVRRLNLSAEDARLWLGILRQMLWKMLRKD
jgi:TrmH family RNA methyltransferase